MTNTFSAGTDFTEKNLTYWCVRFWRIKSDRHPPPPAPLKEWNNWVIVVDPQHCYSNESETVDEDIYDDFKLKKSLCSLWFIQKYFSFVMAYDYQVTLSVQTQDLNFDSWRADAEHTTPQSLVFSLNMEYLRMEGKKHFVSLNPGNESRVICMRFLFVIGNNIALVHWTSAIFSNITRKKRFYFLTWVRYGLIHAYTYFSWKLKQCEKLAWRGGGGGT